MQIVLVVPCKILLYDTTMYSGVMSKESSNAGDLSNGFSAILNVGLKDDLQNRSKNSLNFAQENDLSYRSLVKAGFARPESARKVIEDVCKNCANNSINTVKILESISRVEDPDYAILAFNDIYQSHKKVVENIAQNSNNSLITSPLSSLMQVLGASKAFAMLMRTREDLISAAANDPNHLLHMTLEERVSDLLEAVQSYSATVVN